MIAALGPGTRLKTKYEWLGMRDPALGSPVEQDFDPSTVQGSAADAAFQRHRSRKGMREIRERTALELDRLQEEENDLRRLLAKIDPTSQPPQYLEDYAAEAKAKKTERLRPKTLAERLGVRSLVGELREHSSVGRRTSMSATASLVAAKYYSPEVSRIAEDDDESPIVRRVVEEPENAYIPSVRTPALCRRPLSAHVLRTCDAMTSASAVDNKPLQQYQRPSSAKMFLLRKCQTMPNHDTLCETREGNNVPPAQRIGGAKANYERVLAQQRASLQELEKKDKSYKALYNHAEEHRKLVHNSLGTIFAACMPQEDTNAASASSKGGKRPTTAPAVRSVSFRAQ